MKIVFGACLAGLMLAAPVMASGPLHEPETWSERPVVIAHRGASGVRPEHTLVAYLEGVKQGADYIEPDLVMTKDGILIARHDAYLSTTTDVADHTMFKDRKRTFMGREDWWAFDFTLSEIKMLRAKQARASRGQDFDGAFGIPTFDEVIDLVLSLKAEGRTVGLYPEMKHPGAHLSLGLDPLDALVAGLNRIAAARLPAYIQCFEPDFLVKLEDKSDASRILLIWNKDGRPSHDPMQWRDDIDGVGADKTLIVSRSGGLSKLGQALLEGGLPLHLWTFRDDEVRAGYSSINAELEAAYKAGVSGIFSDFPSTAVKVRDEGRLITPPFERADP